MYQLYRIFSNPLMADVFYLCRLRLFAYEFSLEFIAFILIAHHYGG